MPRRRLDRDDPLPVFDQTRAATLIDPFPRRDHSMGRHSDADGDGLADQAHPIKPPGEPMRYRRDVPRDDLAAIDAETAHIRAHLSAVAATDDDPDTNADDVTITVTDHVDGDPALISITGELDMEPDAPYLRPGYDPDADDDGTRFVRYSEEGQE